MMSNADMATTAGFRFGLNKDLVADRLECLANSIRTGKVIPQGSSSSIGNSQDEFELTTFSVTYAEIAPEG